MSDHEALQFTGRGVTELLFRALCHGVWLCLSIWGSSITEIHDMTTSQENSCPFLFDSYHTSSFGLITAMSALDLIAQWERSCAKQQNLISWVSASKLSPSNSLLILSFI